MRAVKTRRADRSGLLEVVGDQLGHFEHRHLTLAAENLFQFFVGVDQAPVDRVLQLVLLDVVPDLLGDFGARQRIAAHDGGQVAGRRHCLHECSVGFALGGGLLGGFFRRGLFCRGFLLCGFLRRGFLRGRLLGGLLCRFLGSSHCTPSWWLIASMRAMKMESGWNSCQRSLHSIGQIYRILVGVVCKFCVVSRGRWHGCCVGENGSRSLCTRTTDALSLPEVMGRAAPAACLWY